MEPPKLMFVRTIVLLAAMLSATALSDLGYRIEKYDESPGVYYEHKGIAVMYNAEWRTIVYVDLSRIDNDTLALKQYVYHVDMLCQMSIVRNWTGCAHFGDDVRHRLDQLVKTEGLLKEITGQRNDRKRRRRGVFNFVGELSKILFGTLDEDDAKYYNDQIKLFERNSEDVDILLKQQLSVMKSSLGAVNNTLIDMAHNEDILKEGVRKVTDYMNTLKSETNANLNLISTKIEVEGHISKVSRAMNALQRDLDLLIDSVINAHKGVLQPQIVSPDALMGSLIKSSQAFPKDTTLPFPMSKDSTHLLFRLCELQVYIKNDILGYVILLPLVNRGTFDVYKLIPIPIALDRNQYLYIETGKPFLWIDKARQYYFLSDGVWTDTCKLLNPMSYVCKQSDPLLSSHLHENCIVRLLQPRTSVPTICDKRVVELSNSVWTQLANNEWIYFVPKSEGITILCGDRSPIDIVVSGVGKLGINANCKGFGKSALFQTHSILNMGAAGYESDFLSKVNLEYDCCEWLNVKVNLSSVHMNTSFKHLVSHLDDLKIASHKISEVENLIKEQEWKRLHATTHTTYSTLVYICLTLIVLYVLYKLYHCYKLYKCCKRKVPGVPALPDSTGSGNVVNIKIHTSSESLAVSHEDIPLRELSSHSPEVAARRSGRLRASKSCF